MKEFIRLNTIKNRSNTCISKFNMNILRNIYMEFTIKKRFTISMVLTIKNKFVTSISSLNRRILRNINMDRISFSKLSLNTGLVFVLILKVEYFLGPFPNHQKG